MRIVFLGTPEFAVPSLKILVDNGYDVVGVITAPDKPAGRGRSLKMSAVKEYAVSANLKVLQPTNLKSPEFLEELKNLKADLQIVVAFRMLPDAVWKMPSKGTFNLHGSLLPNYRGAAPINWAIINGEKVTGCTTFFLKHEIDTGDLILQREEPIHDYDNVGSLYERLMTMGSELVLESVQKIETGDFELHPQVIPESGVPNAPKIHKETCQIDLTKSSKQVFDFVRGMSPYPCAWTLIEGKKYKVQEVEPTQEQVKEEIETDNKTFLKLQTNDGSVLVKRIQAEGKRAMNIEDFLRGNTV